MAANVTIKAIEPSTVGFTMDVHREKSTNCAVRYIKFSRVKLSLTCARWPKSWSRTAWMQEPAALVRPTPTQPGPWPRKLTKVS